MGMNKAEMIGTLKKIIQVSQHDKEAAHLEILYLRLKLLVLIKTLSKTLSSYLRGQGRYMKLAMIGSELLNRQLAFYPTFLYLLA